MLWSVRSIILKKLAEIDPRDVLRAIGSYFRDHIDALKGRDADGNGVDDYQDLLNEVTRFMSLGARIIERIRSAEQK